MLQTLLEVRIAHFVIRKSIAKLNFREALTRSPELKNLLASYNVRPLNEGILCVMTFNLLEVIFIRS